LVIKSVLSISENIAKLAHLRLARRRGAHERKGGGGGRRERVAGTRVREGGGDALSSKELYAESSVVKEQSVSDNKTKKTKTG